jgi:hypothetical protein
MSLNIGLLLLAPTAFLVVGMAVGILLDLPQSAGLRRRLLPLPMKALALVVAFSPVLSLALRLPEKVQTLTGLNTTVALSIGLVFGSTFTSALAGCWLVLPTAHDPRPSPRLALAVGFALWLLNLALCFGLGLV